MNNLLDPSTALGASFGSIFTTAAAAPANKQSPGDRSAYRPTSISVHSTGSTKICMDCHNAFPLRAVTEIHPVPGLTMYRCADCLTASAAVEATAAHEAEA